MFHADGRTDIQTDKNITKLIDTFPSFPYEPKIFLPLDDMQSSTEISSNEPQIEQANGMYKANRTRENESPTEMTITIQ